MPENPSAPRPRLEPVGDRVLVRPDAERERGGILIPDTAQGRTAQGIVLSTGPGARGEGGARAPPDLRPGDRVFYARHAGTELEFEGERFVVLREEDLLAVVRQAAHVQAARRSP